MCKNKSFRQKAHLVVRMLEDRIGAEQLLQVLNKQLALATTGSQQKWQNRQGWSNMIISTPSFNKSIYLVTGKDTNTFMDQWVSQLHSRDSPALFVLISTF